MYKQLKSDIIIIIISRLCTVNTNRVQILTLLITSDWLVTKPQKTGQILLSESAKQKDPNSV